MRRLRAVPLDPKGAHLHPAVPRAVQRWNGYSWEPYASAANLAATQRLLYPRDEEPSVASRSRSRLVVGDTASQARTFRPSVR
ncbi:DUF6087 family protein [Streptomyces sp. enrichment culture]|uniref:DUF6087 family protein n=1 Tax=Streptomyces sp. enrichment culture TaxID=1795815 RepID=UPI003F54DCBF